LGCTAVVDRPGVVSVALAALVGAVMANVHLACVTAVASVVWVALLAPRRRFVLAGFGASLFALATVGSAPPAWLRDLGSLAQSHAGGSPAVPQAWPDISLVALPLFAIAAWAASFAGRAPVWVAYRRRWRAAVAVLVPLMGAFVAAPSFGIDAGPRYLAHAAPACAVAVAVPIALAAAVVFRTVSSVWWQPLGRVLAFALAVVMAFPVAAPWRWLGTRSG